MNLRKRRRDVTNSNPKSALNGKTKDDYEFEPLSDSPNSIYHSLTCLICGVAIGIIIATVYNNVTQRTVKNHLNIHKENPSYNLEPENVENSGGWRTADEQTVKYLDAKICNIERKFSDEITLDQFESVYRYKKPVIIKFRNGGAGWTNPTKYTVSSLKRAYGEWEVLSGKSDDIVRQGGRGDRANSFQDYVDLIMNDKVDNGEPMYVFDRRFYEYSDLPKTLHLPDYFKVQNDIEDSIFFMGGSRSGVSFHKHADAWNGVIYGRKRWFIYPVHQTPPGGVWPGYSTLEWYKRVYPNLTESTMPLECIQEPGEIMYLPESAYHATLNLGDTVAVGIQKKQTSTEAEEVFYKVLEEVERIVTERKPGREFEIAKEKGLKYFLKLQKLLPNNAEVQMKLGAAYEVSGNMDKALYHTRRAIEIDPFFIVAQVNLALMHKQNGENEEADSVFRRASFLSPENWDVMAQYGEFLMEHMKYEEAAIVFKQGTKIRPQMRPFWHRLAIVSTKLGRHKEADAAKRQLEILNRRVEEEQDE